MKDSLTVTHKWYKLLMIFLILLLCVYTISGSLGTFKRGEPLNVFVVSNLSELNITIYYPNSTKIIDNEAMTKDGYRYNYTFSNTGIIGIYNFNYCDDTGTCSEDDFEITGTGYELTTQKAMIYIGALVILFILFVISIIVYFVLPTDDVIEEDLFSINRLKYLRPVLVMFGYVLLMTLVFTSSNLLIAYFGTELFGSLLFKIYNLMMLLLYPIILFWVIWIFVMIFKDNETKRMLEREIGGR